MLISLFLLIISILLNKIDECCISKGKRKISIRVYLCKQLFVSFSIQIFIISLIEIFISPFFNTSIYEIWTAVPNWKWLLIVLYIVSQLIKTHSLAISFDNNHFFYQIRKEHEAPIKQFEYILIDIKSRFSISEKSLIYLKAYRQCPLLYYYLVKS